MTALDDALVHLAKEVGTYVEYSRPTKAAWWKQVAAKLVGSVPLLVGVTALIFQIPSTSEIADGVLSSRLDNDRNLPLGAALIGAPTASSYRQDVSDSSVFFPMNVLDDDKTTAWAECAGGKPTNPGSSRMYGNTCTTGDLGQGERLTIPLTEPVDIKAIRIRNGYDKNPALFFRNPRVREITIDAEPQDGKRRQAKATLKDEPGYQTVSLFVSDVTRITLTITSAYAGEWFLGGRPFDDTSIADVQIIPSKVSR